MIAPLITETAQNVGAFPSSLESTQMISHSTKEGPVERTVAILIGKAVGNPTAKAIFFAVGSLAAYLILFIWYAGKMKARNRIYLEENDSNFTSAVPAKGSL